MDAHRLRRSLGVAARLADERCDVLQRRALDAAGDDEAAGLSLRAAFQAGLAVGLQQAADALDAELPPDLDERAARAVVADGGTVPVTPSLPSHPDALAAVLDAVHVEHERLLLAVERARLADLVDGLAGLVYAAHLAAATLGVALAPVTTDLAADHLRSLVSGTEPVVDVREQLAWQGWAPEDA